jgi:F420-0:gamma-glutamyl ligase
MPRQRNPLIEVDGRTWRRIPVKTHRITETDDIAEVCDRYSREARRPGDILFVSEKVCAVTQGRAIPVSRIKIGLLARLLWRCVRKVPYGIGLRSPETMQCAIDQTGAARILLAAVVGGITRAFGRRGDFYRIAGMQAATIDAAGTSPMQPDCVILGPDKPEQLAERIRAATGLASAVVDVNDIGGSWVLGAAGVPDRKLIEKILLDNPLGQKDEQTPFGLIRLEGQTAHPQSAD